MFRNLSINQKFLILILVMGSIFTTNFLVLNRVTGEIRKGWINYRDQIAERQKNLMDIKSQFGYGGGIHNLKNYVLEKAVERLRNFLLLLVTGMNLYLDLR